MSNVRNKLIKIAYENPALRSELLPLIMRKLASLFSGVAEKPYLKGIDSEGKPCSVSAASELMIEKGEDHILLTTDIINHIHENHKKLGTGSVFLNGGIPWSEIIDAIHKNHAPTKRALELTLEKDVGYNLLMSKEEFERDFSKEIAAKKVTPVKVQKSEGGKPVFVHGYLVPNAISEMPKTKKLTLIVSKSEKKYLDPTINPQVKSKIYSRDEIKNKEHTEGKDFRGEDTTFLENCFTAITAWPGGTHTEDGKLIPRSSEMGDKFVIVIPNNGQGLTKTWKTLEEMEENDESKK